MSIGKTTWRYSQKKSIWSCFRLFCFQVLFIQWWTITISQRIRRTTQQERIISEHRCLWPRRTSSEELWKKFYQRHRWPEIWATDKLRIRRSAVDSSMKSIIYRRPDSTQILATVHRYFVLQDRATLHRRIISLINIFVWQLQIKIIRKKVHFMV